MPSRRCFQTGYGARAGHSSSLCSALRRASPYFAISSSRTGQLLLTDSRGNLPRPLLAGCIAAWHTVGGRGRDQATGQGE